MFDRPLASSYQRGSLLIEVLVSIVIVAIGLLGLAGLHLRAQQAETESYQRAQALILLNDIEGRIRANREAAFAGNYAVNILGTGAPAITCKATPSTAADRASCDLQQFYDSLLGASELIGTSTVGVMDKARACIEFTAATRTYRVSIVWKGMSALLASSNTCGQDPAIYGVDDSVRRVIEMSIRVPDLSAT